MPRLHLSFSSLPSVALPLAALAACATLAGCASTPKRAEVVRDRATWVSRPGPASVRLLPRAGGVIDLRHPAGDSLLAVLLRDRRAALDTTSPPRVTLHLSPVVLRRLARDLDSLAVGRPPDGNMPAMHGVHLEDATGDLVLALVRVRDSIGLEARAPGAPVAIALTPGEVIELGELFRSFAAYLAIAPSTAPGDGGRPHYLFEVDRPVAPMRGGCFPRYPVQLRDAGITGSLLAEFVVGEDGNVEPATFRAMWTDDALFTDAVRRAAPCMRFTPAVVDGRPVRQLVEMPFTFDIAR